MNRAILICLFSLLRAQDFQLESGKTYERTLEPGKEHTYSANIKDGDRVVVTLQGKDPKRDLVLRFLGPSGALQRGHSTKLDGSGPYEFVARQSGIWKFTVSARGGDGEAAYTLKDFATGPLPALPTVPALTSQRIGKLKNQAQVDALWKEIGPQGGPLLEPIPGNSSHMLVSFVYRGDPSTKGVLVQCELCADPTKCQMARVHGTDLWFLSLRANRKLRTPYDFVINPPDITAMRVISEHGPSAEMFDVAMPYFQRIQLLRQRDPLNPKGWMTQPDDPGPIQFQGRSLLEMPDAPRQPWADKRDGVPEGKVEQTTITSAILKNQRNLFVYTPPGYAKESKTPYPLVIVFDGRTYINVVPTPTTLDNLIADKRIPAPVAVIVGNSGNRRNFELPCNPDFSDFLATELVPWIRSQYHVTHDPKSVVLAGSSYGGLASTCAAYRHPSIFGNVLSQSGSYWWTPPRNPEAMFGFAPDAIPTYIADLFVKSPTLHVRFYLDAGTLEVDRSGKGGSILVPNRHLRDVLRAKGYEVFHQEFEGGHDYASWRGTIADGLILLLGQTK